MKNFTNDIMGFNKHAKRDSGVYLITKKECKKLKKTLKKSMRRLEDIETRMFEMNNQMELQLK